MSASKKVFRVFPEMTVKQEIKELDSIIASIPVPSNAYLADRIAFELYVNPETKVASA